MMEPTSETEEIAAIPAVDEALDELTGLDDRPVVEHVGVFERAHAQLRRALDAPA